jgi:hypothetical protein
MKADGTMEELGQKYFSDAFTITYDDIADPEAVEGDGEGDDTGEGDATEDESEG